MTGLSAFACLRQTPVADLMTSVKTLPVVGGSTEVSVVFALLLTAGGHAWVVDDKDMRTLLGVVTRNDALRLMAAPVGVGEFDKPTLQNLSFGQSLSAVEAMTPKPAVVGREASVGQAIEAMAECKCAQVAVVDEAVCLVGELTAVQILAAYQSFPKQTAVAAEP